MTADALTFDSLAAEQADADRRLHRAMQLNAENANAEWFRTALLHVHRIAGEVASLTADDVWNSLDAFGVLPPTQPKALANVLKQAHREGWIEPSMTFVRCTRPSRNSGTVRVWKSRLVNP